MGDLELLEEEVDEKIEPDFFLKRDYFKDLLTSSGAEDIDPDSFRRQQIGRGELIDNELSIPALDQVNEISEKLIEKRDADSRLSSRPEPVRLTFGDETDLDKHLIKSPVVTLADGREIKIRGSLPPLYLYPDRTILTYDYLSSKSPQLRHWVTPYLINMLLPDEVKRDKGLRASLVSQEKVENVQFAPDAKAQLAELLSVYSFNSRQPVPLYPELAEKLISKKDPEAVPSGKGDLSDLFFKSWSDKEAEQDTGFSPFKSCPYRGKAYKNQLTFDEDQLKSLLKCLYVEIGKAVKGSKDLL